MYKLKLWKVRLYKNLFENNFYLNINNFYKKLAEHSFQNPSFINVPSQFVLYP